MSKQNSTTLVSSSSIGNSYDTKDNANANIMAGAVSGNSSSNLPNTQHVEFDLENEWCVGSGVTKEYLDLLIKTGGLKVYTASETRELLALPKLGLSGDKFWGVRGVDPKTMETTTLLTGKKGLQVKTGGKPKYRTPCGGDTDAILLPLPDDSSNWVLRVLESGCLATTEGGKKAASVMSNSGKDYIPTISVTGVDCAIPETKGGKVRENLKRILSTASKCSSTSIILFDMDFQTNKDVLRALIKTHEEHLSLGFKEVFTPIWNSEYKGVDDMIAAIEPSERERWINDNIRNPKEGNKMTLDKLKELWEKQFEDKKTTIASNKKLSAEDIAILIADDYRSDWKYCRQLGCWLLWNGKVWARQDDKLVQTNVMLLLLSRGIKYGSMAKIKDVVEQLSSHLLTPEWEPVERKENIAYNNGIYNIETGKLEPHYQGSMLTSCLERDFVDIEISDGDTPLTLLERYCPKFYQAYSWQFDNNPYKLLKLLAVIAGCLTFQFRHLQAFVQLEGVPGSGKGMFSRILSNIVGKSNTTPTTMDKLTSDYHLVDIVKSQLVVLADEDKTPRQLLGGLKRLTGQDMVTFREPYGKPGKGYFDGLLLISNNTPIFVGDTTGIDRRNILIKFNKPVQNRDSQIEKDIIKSELDCLMRIALFLTPEQVEKCLTNDNSPGEKSQSLLDKWLNYCENDSVAGWLDENAVKIDTDRGYPISLPSDYDVRYENPALLSLYENYVSYCQVSGRSKLAKPQFGKRLRQHLELLGWEYQEKKSTHNQEYRYQVMSIFGIGLRATEYSATGELLSASDLLRGEIKPEVFSEITRFTRLSAHSKDSNSLTSLAYNTNLLAYDSDLLAYRGNSDTVSQSPQVSTENPKASKPEIKASTEASNLSELESLQDKDKRVKRVETEKTFQQELEDKFASYPHPSSDDNRVKQSDAEKVKQILLNAKNKDAIVAIKDVIGEDRCAWVIERLSDSEKVEFAAKLSLTTKHEQQELRLNTNTPATAKEKQLTLADISPEDKPSVPLSENAYSEGQKVKVSDKCDCFPKMTGRISKVYPGKKIAYDVALENNETRCYLFEDLIPLTE